MTTGPAGAKIIIEECGLCFARCKVFAQNSIEICSCKLTHFIEGSQLCDLLLIVCDQIHIPFYEQVFFGFKEHDINAAVVHIPRHDAVHCPVIAAERQTAVLADRVSKRCIFIYTEISIGFADEHHAGLAVLIEVQPSIRIIIVVVQSCRDLGEILRT